MVSASGKVQPIFFSSLLFVIPINLLHPYPYSVPLRSIVISLMFFYLSKQLFSSFLQLKSMTKLL